MTGRLTPAIGKHDMRIDWKRHEDSVAAGGDSAFANGKIPAVCAKCSQRMTFDKRYVDVTGLVVTLVRRSWSPGEFAEAFGSFPEERTEQGRTRRPRGRNRGRGRERAREAAAAA